MSVADVLVWLGNRERTGTLIIQQGTVAKSVRVERGHVTRVTSTSPRESLAQLLVNFGMISPEAVEAAADAGERANLRLGRMLVLGQLVPEADVRRVLEHQIREAVLDTVRWDVGTFEFDPDDQPPAKVEVQVALSMLSLHKLAASRAPHWAAFHLAFPRLDMRLVVDEAAAAASPSDPTREHILTLARAGATVEAVLQQILLMEYELYARLYELIRAGVLRTLDMQSPPPSISPGEVAFDLLDATYEDRSPLPRAPSARSPINAVIPPQTDAAPVWAAPPARPQTQPAPGIPSPPTPAGGLPVPARITSGLIPPPIPTPPPMPSAPAIARPPIASAPSFLNKTPRPFGSTGSIPLSAGASGSSPNDAPTLRYPAWPTPPIGMAVATAQEHAFAGATPQPGPAAGAVSTAGPDIPSVSRTPPPPPAFSTSSGLTTAAIPQLRGPLDEALRVRSSPRERYILKRIDGTRSVGELLTIVPMTDREVIDVLSGLAAAGLIRF